MPSLKILYLIVALSLASGLIFFSVQQTAPETYNNPANTTTALIVESSLARTSDTDSDKDGLKDWEETLWKTDPNNPDTDGDGMSDGDEVRVGRDPAISGSGNIKSNTSTTTKEPENLTETEKVSREFFEQYLLLKQQGGATNIDAETQARLITELANRQSIFKSTIYSRSDILIDTTKTVHITDYGNQVGKALKNNPLPANQKHEMEIFQAVMNTEHSQGLAKLSPIIDSYTGTIEDLLDIRTPPELVDIHLSIINSMSAVRDSIVAMRDFFDDPVKSLGGIGSYDSNVQTMTDSFSKLRNYFEKNKVTFQQSDDGYIVSKPL